MYHIQQHTMPMTGDTADENSGSGWPCTQPSTNQKKMQGGFLQRLSERSCSMRAVAKPTPIPEEKAIHEDKMIRSWGSVEKLSDENHSLPRSPSLPSLNPTSLSSSRLRGSHFPLHIDTHKHPVSVLNGNSEITPQKKTIYPQITSSETLKFAPEVISKLNMTPQQNTSMSYMLGQTLSVQRPPLTSRTTPQHPPSLGVPICDIKTKTQHQIEKENNAPIQEHIAASVKEMSTPRWRQELLDAMASGTPPQHQEVKSQPMRNTSPSRVMKNLFGDTPLKQTCQAEVISQFKQDSISQETGPSSYGRDNMPDSIYSQRLQTENRNFLNNPKPIQHSMHTPRPSDSDVQQNLFIEQGQKTVDRTFKQPAPRAAENISADVIVVNRVAYIVGQRLGRGGSSEVFQVTRQNDNQTMAIKCVDLRNVDDSIRIGYLNEITMLQKMQGSPRVIQLIDFELCEAKQALLVVMEKGVRDLATFLKERSRRRDLRLGTVEAFWRDMVEAVAAIHEKGIIHSDLKPANFLLVGEIGFHQLKLIDFGIASAIQSDMTSVVRESPAGTLNYMSPEAVRGMQGQQCPVKINYKSDIWSLGCILYNLLYGRTPFQHIQHPTLKAEAICNPRHHIEFPSRSPSLSGNGVLPLPLLKTVQACLSRDPSARPTANQLLAIKYCGCDDEVSNNIDTLALGLASLIFSHPLGKEIKTRLLAVLQEDNKNEKLHNAS